MADPAYEGEAESVGAGHLKPPIVCGNAEGHSASVSPEGNRVTSMDDEFRLTGRRFQHSEPAPFGSLE